jgi:hypothetical protein
MKALDEGQRIVAFYEGNAPDDCGRLHRDILQFDDDRLEDVHDFIQWIFPLLERSGASPSAPVLDRAAIEAFRSRPELRAALRRSFDRMLAFYGFGWSGDRIVKAPAFLDALSEIYAEDCRNGSNRISERTFRFWNGAVDTS